MQYKLVPRVSLLPFPWSRRKRVRDGKKRDPGNEVGFDTGFMLSGWTQFSKTVLYMKQQCS